MIEIKDLTKGQVVYECEGGLNKELTIMSTPNRDKNMLDQESMRCSNCLKVVTIVVTTCNNTNKADSEPENLCTSCFTLLTGEVSRLAAPCK